MIVCIWMAIHNYNSSYVCIVLKHTFLLWAQYLRPLKLWEVPSCHSAIVFVQWTLSGKDKCTAVQNSVLVLMEFMSPHVHLGLVTFGLSVMDSWTEPGFLRGMGMLSLLISLTTLKRSNRPPSHILSYMWKQLLASFAWIWGSPSPF